MSQKHSLAAVLTVTTDRFLCSDIGELYDLLNYMTGDNLFTHQLPRATKVCKPVLLAQFPTLADVTVPYFGKYFGKYKAWLLDLGRVRGHELDVEPLESWQHRNPIDELDEMLGGTKPIIVVAPYGRCQVNRDDAMAYHPSGVGKMLRDVEAFTRDAAYKGIDVSPLLTASDFHAEISRRVEKPKRHVWYQQESRPRKARRHNRFAVALLMVASVLMGVLYFASDAKADTADDWAGTYWTAVCNTPDDYPTVSGLTGVLLVAQEHSALTDEEAGYYVGMAVVEPYPCAAAQAFRCGSLRPAHRR